MSKIDPEELGRTLTTLLRKHPEAGGLRLEKGRWAALDSSAEAMALSLGQAVDVTDILALIEGKGSRFLELDEGGNRVRAKQRKPRQRSGVRVPELLFHGTTVQQMQKARDKGVLSRRQGRPVFFSASESQAWLVAHRLKGHPAVLYVEAQRASRDGVAFRKGRNSLFLAEQVPKRHLLNLHDGFAEQHSAGGVLIRNVEGNNEVALVACRRGRRVCWEIAKGKLEHGESPQQAAIREMQEEMGFEADLEIVGDLGFVQYAFNVPNLGPRLKTLFVYVVEAQSEVVSFDPQLSEGIEEVRWFPVKEAVKLVPHRSLRPIFIRLAEQYA
ncbi:MAG: NUDIX domain-containing protein [Myxococcota bacterium]|nr:NUDIX domain-containing protein [Myxococcota bacterium]